MRVMTVVLCLLVVTAAHADRMLYQAFATRRFPSHRRSTWSKLRMRFLRRSRCR